jgi:putative endonuclease
MAFYVYALVNPSNEIYIGQTKDLERRIEQHNNPEINGTLHTKRHPGPWVLFYKEQCPTRSEAMKREKQLKSYKGREFLRSLIIGTNDSLSN